MQKTLAQTFPRRTFGWQENPEVGTRVFFALSRWRARRKNCTATSERVEREEKKREFTLCPIFVAQDSPVLAVLFSMPVQLVPFWLSDPACHGLAVSFWLSCSNCFVLAVLSFLSCLGCLILTLLPCLEALSWQSCLGIPVLAFLPWQLCSACSVLLSFLAVPF
jgi:hypothetical protein